MRKLLIILFVLLIFNSCNKECQCDIVTYESNMQNNYNWTEINREYANECKEDTISGTYLDNEGNISYVSTIVECE